MRKRPIVIVLQILKLSQREVVKRTTHCETYTRKKYCWNFAIIEVLICIRSAISPSPPHPPPPANSNPIVQNYSIIEYFLFTLDFTYLFHYTLTHMLYYCIAQFHSFIILLFQPRLHLPVSLKI